MSDKKIPLPPILPPTFTFDEKFCLFHKGDIKGEIYICPSCKTNYCLKCAKKARKEGKICIKCRHLVLI
jgi:hypothetical protein